MPLALRLQARDIALSETVRSDPAGFALRAAGKYEPELLRLVATHLDYLQTIRKKIPSWFSNERTLPYTGINLEQSSSEITARYKAHYLKGEHGLDLSGGLGVDSYFMAQNFRNFIHNEPDTGLSQVVRLNFTELGVENVKFTSYPAEAYPWPENSFDWVYLDPSRRNQAQQRVVLPEDCQPDLPALRTQILRHSSAIMVKYSPMLDIHLALRRLETVHEVLILAERNEVKELVFILRKTACPHPLIRCVNLATSQPEFTFTQEEEKCATPVYGSPLHYLYEPNSAIMKAGAFHASALRYGLEKIGPNSHLYTHSDRLEHYPGKVLAISAVTSFEKKRLNSIVPQCQANIVCRNFPLKPDEARRKLGWKDGGDTYLYLTEDKNKQKLAIVAKIVQHPSEK